MRLEIFWASRCHVTNTKADVGRLKKSLSVGQSWSRLDSIPSTRHLHLCVVSVHHCVCACAPVSSSYCLVAWSLAVLGLDVGLSVTRMCTACCCFFLPLIPSSPLSRLCFYHWFLPVCHLTSLKAFSYFLLLHSSLQSISRRKMLFRSEGSEKRRLKGETLRQVWTMCVTGFDWLSILSIYLHIYGPGF